MSAVREWDYLAARSMLCECAAGGECDDCRDHQQADAPRRSSHDKRLPCHPATAQRRGPVFGNDPRTAFIACTVFKRLLAWLRRQPPDIGGTNWALIGILVLVGIVLAIPLGIALRVRSRTAARWSNT